MQGRPWNGSTPVSARKESNTRSVNSALGVYSPHSSTIGHLKSIKQDNLYGSPVQKLFNLNKETVEEMLIRKFRTKYIDTNPAFAKDLGDLEKISPRGPLPG